MSHFFRRCHSQSTGTPAAHHQLHPVMHRRAYYPPYTVRYAAPITSAWPIVPTVQNQNRPIRPRPRRTRFLPPPRTPTRPSVPPPRTPIRPSVPPPQNVLGPPTRSGLPQFAHNPGFLHKEFGNPPGIYPFLDWDITKLPSSSRRQDDGRNQSTPAFEQPALVPRCNNIKIVYDHPTFHPLLRSFGPITVYPLGNATTITVEDTMDAIHRHFQQPITRDQWYSTSFPEQQQILEAYFQRINVSPGLRQIEATRGPIRVDALKRCTRFSGLQRVSFLNRSAVLYMCLAPSESS